MRTSGRDAATRSYIVVHRVGPLTGVLMHDALRSRSSPLHPDRRKRPGSAHRAHGPHQSGGRGSAGAEVDWSEWSPRRIRASVRTLTVTVPCQCLSERTPHMWSILTSHSAKGYQSTPRSRSQTAHQAAGLRAARDVLEPEESDPAGGVFVHDRHHAALPTAPAGSTTTPSRNGGDLSPHERAAPGRTEGAGAPSTTAAASGA